VTSITNTAVGNDDGTNGADPTPGNNTGTDTDTLNAAPDIAVTKTADATIVNGGSPVGFTITVSIVGQGTAQNVAFDDSLFTGLTWSVASSSGPGTFALNTVGGVQHLTYSAAVLTTADVATVHFTAPTTTATCVTIPNTVTVTSTSGDSNPSNNTASASIDVITTTRSISFDPDGSGPLPAVTVASFDPAPGSFLAVGALPGGPNSGVNTTAGVDFEAVSQARLSALRNTNNQALSVPGLNSTFTYVTLTDVGMHGASTNGGTSVALGQVMFGLPTGTGLPNTFQLRYHPLSTPLNEQTGGGYNTGTDTLILSGHVVAVQNASVATLSLNGGLLNQSTTPPADVATERLSGSLTYVVAVDSTNPAFFPDPTATLSQLTFTTPLSSPFKTVTPNAGTFWTGTARNVGSLNGSTGPNVELQADSSYSVLTLCAPAGGVAAALIAAARPGAAGPVSPVAALFLPSVSGFASGESAFVSPTGPTAGQDPTGHWLTVANVDHVFAQKTPSALDLFLGLEVRAALGTGNASAINQLLADPSLPWGDLF
jgi:hypothetical protein